MCKTHAKTNSLSPLGTRLSIAQKKKTGKENEKKKTGKENEKKKTGKENNKKEKSMFGKIGSLFGGKDKKDEGKNEKTDKPVEKEKKKTPEEKEKEEEEKKFRSCWWQVRFGDIFGRWSSICNVSVTLVFINRS